MRSLTGLLAVLSLAAASVAQAQGTVGKPQALREFRDCADCPVMLEVPPGSYIRGSTPAETRASGTPDRDAVNEQPQMRVTIGYRFAVGKFEITRAQWARFARETRRELPKDCLSWDVQNAKWGRFPGVRNWQSPGFAQADDHPVVCINWFDARDYIDWLSKTTGRRYRFLTDAEWEYMARAGSSTVRHWGDELEKACEYGNVADLTKSEALRDRTDPEHAVQCRDGFVYTAPVGRFKPNNWGFHDLMGNAWEWTYDCMVRTYIGSPTDGSARPHEGECIERVMRGSAWHAQPFAVRSAKHDWAPPALRSARMGLRVAREL